MDTRSRLRLDRGTLAGFGAIVLWSATAALTRRLTEQLGSFRAAAAIYVVAGSLCLVWMTAVPRTVREMRRLPVAYLVVCGPLFVFYMVGLVVAIGRAADRRQVFEVALVNYLWCPLTLLLSIPVLGKRARPGIVPGTALVLVGLYLVLRQDASTSWASLRAHVVEHPLPYAAALAVAVAWGLYSTLTRRLAGAENAGGVLLFLPAAGAVLSGLAALAGPEEGAWTARAVGEALFLGSSTAAAYFLWDHAMRKGDVVLVAASSNFVPLLSTLVSCLVLAVLPGATLWIGCLLLVLGSFASWLSLSDRSTAGRRPAPHPRRSRTRWRRARWR